VVKSAMVRESFARDELSSPQGKESVGDKKGSGRRVISRGFMSRRNRILLRVEVVTRNKRLRVRMWVSDEVVLGREVVRKTAPSRVCLAARASCTSIGSSTQPHCLDLQVLSHFH
jgi:hypothetical protein